MSRRLVSYYYDNDLGSYTYGLGHPMKPHRIRMTHELLSAYNMLDKMHILRPKRATPEAMTAFHTDEYVHFLKRVTPETAEELTFGGQRFLVGEDNPAFEGVFEFCSISAGGSIGAAQRIATGAADIAINWSGGLHHAKKREASGFCYINDIVLGILELLRTYPRILYVDIDCHHGDGVEEAFYTTNRVMTCSFHKFGEYFPGTGTQEDRGKRKGEGYAVNVPFKDGITDENFKSVFEPVIDMILDVYKPSVVVLQCGADSLAGDKLGCFNVTMHGHAHCVQHLRKTNIPLILLGGGGYTVKNVARTWTYETACALGIEDTIDPNLPWNEYFEWFGPRYRLEVPENNMDDLNVKEGTLDRVRTAALQQVSQLPPAPSVGMHDVPYESVGQHLGLLDDEDDDDDDEDDEEEGDKKKRVRDKLDDRLAQHARLVYGLQASDSTDASDLDSLRGDSDSDDRSAAAAAVRRGRKRMSLLTGQYIDSDTHASRKPQRPEAQRGRRHFFASSAKWDAKLERVVLLGGTMPPVPAAMTPDEVNGRDMLKRRRVEEVEAAGAEEEEEEGEEVEEGDAEMLDEDSLGESDEDGWDGGQGRARFLW